MIEYAWLIPLFPILAFLIIMFFGGRMKEGGGYVAIATSAMSFAVSVFVILEVLKGRTLELPGTFWIYDKAFQFGIFVDQLTALMLFVVSFVGLIIMIYSLGYMHGDEGLQRYYAQMSLFIASMFILVLANNFVLLYISWELVGLCSYFLIGFWYKKPSAASAAKKAFIVTRSGDILFLIGILLLYNTLGTLNLREVFSLGNTLSSSTLTLATLLILGGAIGKSAQFPLQVWLPDAMEGPTTVSALIHAATMVKAGVYLVARCLPLFVLVPNVMLVVAYIGAITAFIAATMGTVMVDIKRIIAYSTMSHLGLMMLALGAGGYAAGLFHLLNHNFFKALLFLSAGSVLHATQTFDIRELGGLYGRMRTTAVTALIAAWSASGIPILSGFWSKDEILIAVYNYDTFLFLLTLATAFLSAFYIFRWYFIIFTGKASPISMRAHESPNVIAYPLIILAIGAAFSWIIIEWFRPWIELSLPFALPSLHEGETLVIGLSTIVALLGFVMAWAIYYQQSITSYVFTTNLKPLHTFVVNKYYMDHIYNAFAEKVVAGFCFLLDKFDLRVIDGTVNSIGVSLMKAGGSLRKIQTGIVQDYASAVLLGVSILLITIWLWGFL